MPSLRHRPRYEGMETSLFYEKPEIEMHPCLRHRPRYEGMET